jgi:hypothetical protein
MTFKKGDWVRLIDSDDRWGIPLNVGNVFVIEDVNKSFAEVYTQDGWMLKQYGIEITDKPFFKGRVIRD